MADLRIVLVTPEKTLFDCPVTSIRVPMFDGSAGFYPGRAPLVGRLGVGELRFAEVGGTSQSYFIEGGFVQVQGPQVSVLTNAARPVSELSRKEASSALAAAQASRPKNDTEAALKLKNLERIRKMQALATRD